MSRRYYAASYGPRYSDPTCTYVALEPLSSRAPIMGASAPKVRDAAERAAEYERNELPGYCEIDHDESFEDYECQFCNPDVVAGDAYAYDAAELFTVEELREHRHALAMGAVVALTR